MRRRGAAVLLEFWLPLNPEGPIGRSNLDAHFGSTAPARMRAPNRGAHAVEFSKTAAPDREGDSFADGAPGRDPLRAGLVSIAPMCSLLGHRRAPTRPDAEG